MSLAIKVALLRATVTHREIAEVLGLSTTSISNRMSGRTGWRVDELRAISKHLKIPIVQLLDTTEDVTTC